ncbi:hypothetical protein BUALT_Bualt06G0052000 [Buddleja alternifolia]|uniref:Myb/SANT-like domain-containing protein n=1 Tax=Buddleja alternifolia TaxID=168488 RepID=A0AAV6XE81_9LAMI|nr:hypothetical protein BUALT_Bualt06G0052000 [Buddleja alternifolia]
MGSYQRTSGKRKLDEVKAHWTPDNREMFIDLCLEQISQGNKPGTHLTREGWKNILDSFRTMTGQNYSRIQLKNHWDMTKKHWKVWHKLISTEHMKWNPVTRTFRASREEWDEYILANPDAAQFRCKELLFADKLDSLFSGSAEHCNHNNYATETERPTRARKRQHVSINTVLPVEEAVGGKPHSNAERCYDAVESRSITAVQSPPSKLSYSIEECIKCLDSTEDVEEGSEVYLFALDIFLKKEYREIFLNLKKSSTRVAWLQRLQSCCPPLPLD